MAKCTRCYRGATDGFRTCLRCRGQFVRRQKTNREAGRRQCGRPALANYASCRSCLLSVRRYDRRRYGFKTKCLYVVETAYGVKIGQSHVPRNRALQFRHTMLAGLDKSFKLIRSYEEKGHLEKLVQWELAEYCVASQRPPVARDLQLRLGDGVRPD